MKLLKQLTQSTGLNEDEVIKALTILINKKFQRKPDKEALNLVFKETNAIRTKTEMENKVRSANMCGRNEARRIIEFWKLKGWISEGNVPANGGTKQYSVTV